MKNKFILLVFIILFSLILVGCEEKEDPHKLIAISMDETTVPEKVSRTDVLRTVNQMAIILHYQNGAKEYIGLNKEMMTNDDYESLFSVGYHTVKVTYMEFETEFSMEVYEVVYSYYTVNINYPDGSPVLSDVIVKWIKNSEFARTTTLEEGKTQISDDGSEYLIRLLNIPEGYTYNPNIYIVNSETKEVNIKLIQYSDFIEGSGTQNDPYSLNCGTFLFSNDVISLPGVKFYGFYPSKSGTYTIESFAEEKHPSNSCDPYLGFLGEKIDFGNVDYSGNLESYVNINFKYTFEAEVGKIYYFMVFLSLANDLPASYNVSIYEN